MKKYPSILIVLFMCVATTHAQWSLTGNAGTTPPTNFIGTTDAQNLVFKVNNVFSGIIDLTYNNTGFGYGSLSSNSTGNANTAQGYRSLLSNTSGAGNTAHGFNALYSNTTGGFNTAGGANVLLSNTTGSFNNAYGFQALFSNTSGYDNTANGVNALYYNTTGNSNTATGNYALQNNITGYENTAMGHHSLYNNITGYYNTSIGGNSLLYNTTGSFNTAYGTSALISNISGHHNVAMGYVALCSTTWGDNNVAYGNSALYSNIGGSNNLAVGNGALLFFRNNSSYGANVAVGNDALFTTTTGIYNTAVGALALNTNATGSSNTAIGYYADVNTDNLSNANAIGTTALATASNQVRIGNSSITSIGGYASWTNISDGRVKKNIQSNVPGLSFINKLNPVTYNLDLAAAENILSYTPAANKLSGRPKAGETLSEAKKEKEQIVYTGFVAQEVEEAAKSLEYNFSGVDAPKNGKDLYGLRYAEFVVPLVKAVQELSDENTKKNSTIQTLTDQVSQLQKQMDLVISQLNEVKNCCSASLQKAASAGADAKSASADEDVKTTSFLQQNFPNPFNAETSIRYYISPLTKNSTILVTDANGHNLKVLSPNTKGSGTASIKATELAPGTYFYTLIVDGKKVDTKTMIIF